MTSQQEIDFRGTGLDTDSDIRVMAPGDSDERWNCILDATNDQSLGNIQNDWGFLLQNYTQPTGTNEVIGSVKDLERNAIIYFVYNSLGNHQIRRWFTITGNTELILQSNILNFQSNYKIYHANVLGDLLLWTDGYQSTSSEIVYNSPREISIEKSIGYTQGLPWPQGYTTVDLQTIEAIKYPTLHSPTETLVTVAGVQSLLVGKYHQFFTQYEYYEFSKSVWSPIAPLVISQNEDGNGNYIYDVDNAIDLTFETGHFTATRIRIGAKINGAYYLVDVLDKYDANGNVIIPSGSTHTYRYFGDRQLGILSEAEVLKTQDYLPQVANCQEIVMGNTLVYANYIEGLAAPVTNLSATVKIKKATNTAPVFNDTDFGDFIKYRALSLKRLGIYRLGIIYKKTQGYTCPVSSPDTAQVQIPSLSDPSLYPQYFDVNDEWILTLNQKPYIEWNITSTPPIWADAYEVVCTKDLRDLERTFYFPQWGAALGDEDGIFQNDKTSLLIPSTVGYSFEQGDRIRLVAQYTDTTTLGRTLALTAPLPFGGGLYPQTRIETYTNIAGITYDYAIQKFENGRVHISGEVVGLDATVTYVWEIYNPTRKTTASADGGEDGEIFYGVGQTYDILNPGQPNRTHSVQTSTIEGIDVFHRWKKLVWRPQNVKFKVDQIASPYTPPTNPPNASAILKVGNLVTNTIFKNAISTVPNPVQLHLNDTKTSALTEGFKDEKYGTSFNGSWATFNLFYEPASPGGLVIDSSIINVLCGNLVGQNVQLIAQSLFNQENIVSIQSTATDVLAGNINWILDGGNETTISFDTRNNVNLSEDENEFNIYLLCEDHNLSDFYPSDIDSVGKGYIENPLEVRKRYPTYLRHGGQFFRGTSVNNLLSFNSADSDQQIPITYNDITRIRYVGYTLNIRQRNKNNSMYIGRQQLEAADGAQVVALSDAIFGPVNPSPEYYGSYHPGGDVKSSNNMYYFDVTNGKVVRDSNNGQIPISSYKEGAEDPYKMDNYFRRLASKVRNGGDRYEVIGVWDEVIDCYILTVRDVKEQGADSSTVIFHEPSNRWKSFMNYTPEWYESLGEITVSFKDGELWKHYADPNNRNTYYGVHYPQKVAVIVNAGYNTRKVFNNIKIDSNVSWDSNITTPPNATYPSGMKSRLRKEKLQNMEGGGFYGSFMKDMNTPGFSNPTLALVNGRELRGEVMKILLENNESTFVYLRQVIVMFTVSEQTT